MSWAKLSDDYSDDCWTLSDAAFRLHTEALVWNGRKLLDCRIPADDVRRFAKHPDAVAELLACGWWSAESDVYVIRHHASYQRTREAVVNQQKANAANGAKGGRPREQVAQLHETHLLTESETESLTESLSGSETERDRTGQATTQGREEPSRARAREAPAPATCSLCRLRPVSGFGFDRCDECAADAAHEPLPLDPWQFPGDRLAAGGSR